MGILITSITLGIQFSKRNDTNVSTTNFPPTHSPTSQNSNPSYCEMPWEWNVIYVDCSIDWNDIGTDIKAAVEACFNVIIISFWISGRLADAAQVWGQTMSEEQRQSALN